MAEPIKMENKSVTIIGATGLLGRPVAFQLLKKGLRIKAIVRDVKRAQELLPKEVEFVQGDLMDVEGLRKCLEKTEYLYMNLSTKTTEHNLDFYPEREGIYNILEAVDRKSIKQIIKISGINSIHPEFSVKGMVRVADVIRESGEKAIKESGIPYTMLCPAPFLDMFLKLHNNGVIRILGPLPYKCYCTNSIDMAEHIFQSIGNSLAMNKSLPIQGLEAYTPHECLEILKSELYPQAKIKMMPLWLAGLISRIIPAMQPLVEAMRFAAQYKPSLVSESSWKIIGKPTLNAREFFKFSMREGFPQPKPVERIVKLH
jgi:hypothetical protein